MDTREIVTRLARTLDKDEATTRALVEQVTQTFTEELAVHDVFRLPGLGTFGTHRHAARRWFDPLRRRVLRLPEYFTVFFHASRELKQKLNERK